MPTKTTTLQTLLAAIDQGDRTALYPLADLLMEQGDPRGEGVLWLAEEGKWPAKHSEAGGFFWSLHQTALPAGEHEITRFCFWVLKSWHNRTWGTQSQSAAILDAAQAWVAVHGKGQ